MVRNKGLVFKKIPEEFPVEREHLVIENRDFDIDQTPPQGGLILENYSVSYDPYQRGKLRDPSIQSYTPAYPLGQAIQNSGIARVVKSGNDKFKEGDVVLAYTGIEEYTVLDAGMSKMVRKLENPLGLDPQVFLGALGMPGITAYSSLYKIGEPKKGEVIWVSAASGAVGQIVGQLAKHEGLTVIGSVGDDKKLDFITKTLGFDGGFNYKKEKPIDALKRLAPKGIDIYYENVGGEQLETAIEVMRPFGRIIASGMISQYNLAASERYGVKNLMYIVGKRIKFQGFIQSDPGFADAYTKDHQQNLAKWIDDGSFKVQMDVTEGIDNAAKGFIGMLKGDNFGKALVQIKPFPKEQLRRSRL